MKTIKEQNSKRYKMSIDIAFNFLDMRFDWKASSQRSVPQAGNAIEEMVNIYCKNNSFYFASENCLDIFLRITMIIPDTIPNI